MNIDAKRYYAMLGLDPTCSDEDVRIAFRRLAKEVHPDAESGDVTAFIRLKHAYDTLSDPKRRAYYDRMNNPRLRRAMHAVGPPLPPRARPPRPGGISFVRYSVAFLFMGGLSFGAIEAMISYADVPAAGVPHPVSLLAGAAKEAANNDTAAAISSASVGPGFWDPSSPNGTPRDTTTEERTARKRSSGLGTFSSE